MTLRKKDRRPRYGACKVPTCIGTQQGWSAFCSRHVKPIMDGVDTVDDYKAWLEVEMAAYEPFERPDEIRPEFWPPRPFRRGPSMEAWERAFHAEESA